MEHYFSNNSKTEFIKHDIEYYINGEKLIFTSSNAVFSKTKVDFGSDLLIKTFLQEEGAAKGELLDVGCGYGTFGVTLTHFNKELKATMVDVNERAIELASFNAEKLGVKGRTNALVSDKLENVTEKYDYVVTNPPIRAGKDVVHGIYEGAFEHLNSEGKLYVVIQKKQGAGSSIKKMEELFGNCETVNKKAGYFILVAKKN